MIGQEDALGDPAGPSVGGWKVVFPGRTGVEPGYVTPSHFRTHLSRIHRKKPFFNSFPTPRRE